MSGSKRVIVERLYYNKICKLTSESEKICIEIWDPDKGLVYIWIKETEDVLKLKRFFESVEIKQENTE